MTPEQFQQVIDWLVNTGGMLANAGFELAVKRAWVVGLTDLILGIVGFVLFLIVGIMMIKNKDNWSNDEMVMGGGSGLLVFGSFGLFYLISGIQALLLPEWKALELIFGLVTGGS
jgi:hypothetical protein